MCSPFPVSKQNSDLIVSKSVTDRIQQAFFIKQKTSGSTNTINIIPSVIGNDTQVFFIYGSAYTNIPIAYIALCYAGTWTIVNLLNDFEYCGTLTVDGNTFTANNTYISVSVLSTKDFS